MIHNHHTSQSSTHARSSLSTAPTTAAATSSSSSSVSSPSSAVPSSRVSQWSVFLDHYEATVGNIRRNFDLLATVRDLSTQQRLVDDVEQELFDSKQQLESVQHETLHFPYHLRSKAVAQIQQCKEQLEQYYATLLIYQQTHKQGQIVTPQLLQREQQHQAALEAQHSDGALNGGTRPVTQLVAIHSPTDDSLSTRGVLDEDNIDDTTRLLSPTAFSSSSASPSPSSSSPSSALSSSQRAVTFPVMNAQRASLVSAAGHHVDFNEAANRTHSSLLQSADIGQETGRLLAAQRESLGRQQMALHHSDTMSAESSRSMDRIHCRRISDNLIAWLIVALQIGLFCLIARVKYFSY